MPPGIRYMNRPESPARRWFLKDFSEKDTYEKIMNPRLQINDHMIWVISSRSCHMAHIIWVL